MHNLVLSPIGIDLLVERVAKETASIVIERLSFLKIESKPQKKDNVNELYLISDVANILKCKESTVRSLILKGNLAAHKQGKCWYVKPDDLKIYLDKGRRKTHEEVAQENDTFLSNRKKAFS